jgi:hypothetical protein
LALMLLSHFGLVPLAWSWLIVIGTAITFVLGYLLGPLMPGSIAKNRSD